MSARYRLRDYKRALGNFGVLVENTGRGKHPWKATRDGISIPIPVSGLHGEVAKAYFKNFCRSFRIDEERLRRALDGEDVTPLPVERVPDDQLDH